MQKIKLVPDIPFATKLDIAVYTICGDYQKKRCIITADFARGDIDELKRQGMELSEALEYYKSWIYDVVRYHILDEWEAVSGLDEAISIINEKIKDKF